MNRSERREKLRRIRYEQGQAAKDRRAAYEQRPDVRAKRAEYATTEARQLSRATYEAGTGKATRAAATDQAYRDRQIIAIDGEGVTGPDGKHVYVLLAASTGDRLFIPTGITSVKALNWLVDLRRKYPEALFVSFGFSYDITKILIDVRRKVLQRLRKNEYVQVGAWRLWWRPGKSFGVGLDVNLTIWDLRAFFRGSFITALEAFIDDIPPEIIDGKAGRGLFTLDNINSIKEYNQIELDYMVLLAEQIRGRLYDLGIKLNRFDGSGAIAAALMRSRDVKQHVPEVSQDIGRLLAGAFIGGRIECIQYGNSNRGGYQYDMRAAYPWAMTLIPSFIGTWRHHKTDPGQLPYTVYKVEWDGWHDPLLPAPLPYRTRTSSIVFPTRGKSLVWSPEVEILRQLPAGALNWRVVEAWQFIPDNPDLRPWAFTKELYELRQGLEAVGNNGAAAVLKLGTNAMWGKLAQRIGWTEQNKPGYHHLGAAGLVTSIVRAELYKVAQTDLEAVIAIETDALVTRRRLPNADKLIGPDMGQWKETRFTKLTYANTGLAFGTLLDGREVLRSSGIPRGNITNQMILDAAKNGLGAVDISRNYFMGITQADSSNTWDNLGEWITKTDKINIRPTGKRIPLPGPGSDLNKWNATICPVLPTEMGQRYLVPWDLEQLDLEQYLEQEYKTATDLDLDTSH